MSIRNVFKKKSQEKRSPITAPPLRYPGQSLDEEIQDIIENKLDEYAAWGAIFIGFTLYEWLRWYFEIPPHPVAATFGAALLCGYVAFRIRQYRGRVRILRQARDGEKAVGQYLELLREKGYRIFHDILGRNFNIDHVLVGSAGVFTIETKTISKPLTGQAKVDYDGEKISVNGFSPDRDPIVQAKAQAHWLRDFIKESTGRTVRIRPVVLYPGWFVSKQPKGVEVWTLNPKNLPDFLDNEKPALAPEDVKLIAYHLARYIRGSCKKL